MYMYVVVNYLLEIIVVWNNRVSKFDHSATSLFECLLQQDGLQCRIEFLGHVLKKARLTKSHGIF